MDKPGKNSSPISQDLSLDTGTRLTYGYFPARNIIRCNSDSGAWLAAYRQEQARRFNAVLCSNAQNKDTSEELGRDTRDCIDSFGNRRQSLVKNSVLLRRLSPSILLHECLVRTNTDIASINISGKKLTNPTTEEDFRSYKNVYRIQASDNALSVEAFKTFPSLEELELQVNGINRLQLSEDMFLFLKVLDLSFNKIHYEDLSSLGMLRSLEKLILTGNELEELPVDFGAPYLTRVSGLPGDLIETLRFPQLQELHLDHNTISDPSIFFILASLTRLKVLNLSNNRLSCIPPLMKIMQSTDIINDSSRESYGAIDKCSTTDYVGFSAPHNSNDNTGNLLHFDTEMEQLSKNQTQDHGGEGDRRTENRVVGLEDELEALQKSSESKLRIGDLAPTDLPPDAKDFENMGHNSLTDFKTFAHTNKVYFPYPSLEVLDVSHNAFEEEEALLALSACQKLKELFLWGNPLTENKGGGPAILYGHLTQICGIDIKRKKPSFKGERLPVGPLIAPVAKLNRVKDVLPPIRKPNQLMLDFQKKELEWIQKSSHPIEQGSTRIANAREAGKDKNENPENSSESCDLKRPLGYQKAESEATMASPSERRTEDDPRVFLTQIEDNKEESDGIFAQLSTIYSKEESMIENKQNTPSIADILAVDKESGEHMPLPTTLRGSIVALKHALNHPLVFRNGDLSSKLPTTQMRRRVMDKVQSASPLSQGKVKRAQLVSALDRMRTESITVEENLGSVLKAYAESPKLRKEFPEVKQLVKEVQNKYDEVRAASLQKVADTQRKSGKNTTQQNQLTTPRNRRRSDKSNVEPSNGMTNRGSETDKGGHCNDQLKGSEAEETLESLKLRVETRI